MTEHYVEASVGFPSHWKIIEIGEIADITKLAGYEFTKHVEYTEDGEIIALRALNVVDGQLDLTNVKKIAKKVSDGLERSKLYKNDILLTYTGKIGDVAMVDVDDRYHLAPNICRLRIKEHCDISYIFNYLRSKEFKKSLFSYTVGSTQPTIPMKSIRKIKIPLPSIEEQRAIANFINPYSEKIELNRQVNQTLEQMAQAIFKSWFVDFDPVKAKIEAKTAGRDSERGTMCAISGKTEAELELLSTEQRQQLAATAVLFPDELVESELGLIPQGWEVVLLKDITSKIGSGATPRGGKEVYLEEGTALIRSQNVYDSLFVWNGLARISNDAAHQLNGVTVNREDVLLNITGASILRTCIVVPEALPARVNQHVAIIRANKGIPPRFIHLHLLQQKTKSYLMGLNAGASREAVTKGNIESVPMLKPKIQLLAKFQEVTTPIFAEINQLEAEIRNLSTIRDTLLPRLLTGEIDLNQAV